MALVKKEKAGEEVDYTIKPEAITPKVDTSEWPLLLRNWDQRTRIQKTWCLGTWSVVKSHSKSSPHLHL